MSGITPTIVARLQGIADHPLADGTTLEQFLQTASSSDMDAEAYCDVLEMQMGVLTAISRFADQREAAGDNQATILCGLGGSFGIMIGRMTMRHPVEGRDAADCLGQMIAERFNRLMSNWFAWRDTPTPKTPTHQHPQSLN